MTREEVEKQVVQLGTGAICHCRERAGCKRHQLMLAFALDLVSRAYEEVAARAKEVGDGATDKIQRNVVEEGYGYEYLAGVEDTCGHLERFARDLKANLS
jgi:hypothetical protein